MRRFPQEINDRKRETARKIPNNCTYPVRARGITVLIRDFPHAILREKRIEQNKICSIKDIG